MDVDRGQFGGAAQRALAVTHAVEGLVALAQAAQDQHRVVHRRFRHHDLLKAPRQRVILLEVAAVLLVGGGADAAQLAAAEHRLEEVGGVQGAARGGAGADHGVDLVDEQDRAALRLHRAQHPFDALLEVAAESGAGQQRAQIEGDDAGAAERRRHLAAGDALRQAFDDGGLADSGIPHQYRVVLLPASQNLQRAGDLAGAADQRVDASAGGARRQVGGEPFQELARIAAARGAARLRRRALGGRGSELAVGDHLQHVAAGNALLLEEPGGVRVGLQQQRGEQVAGLRRFPLRAAYLMNHPLQQPPYRARNVQFVGARAGHRLHVVVEEGLQAGAQLVGLAPAGTDDRRPVVVVQQRVQQVLHGHELVAPHLRLPKRRRQRQLYVTAQHRRIIPLAANSAAETRAGAPADAPARSSFPPPRGYRRRSGPRRGDESQA